MLLLMLKLTILRRLQLLSRILINAARNNDDEALDKQWNQDDPLQTYKKQRLNNSSDAAVVVSGEDMQINSNSSLSVGPAQLPM